MRLLALALVTSLFSLASPLVAEECLSPLQARSLTTLLVDKASEVYAKTCVERFPANAPVMAKNRAQIEKRFNELRDPAFDVLMDRYAPALKGKPAGQRIVSGFVDVWIKAIEGSQFTAQSCAEADIMVEAMLKLDEQDAVAVAEVFLRRSLADDPDSDLQFCEMAEVHQWPNPVP